MVKQSYSNTKPSNKYEGQKKIDDKDTSGIPVKPYTNEQDQQNLIPNY